MTTPATYKILHWEKDWATEVEVDMELFFYVPGDNTPEKTALRFKTLLNNYNANQEVSPADAFIKAIKTSRPGFSYRDSHSQDTNTPYRYTLESSEGGQGLFLIAETVKRSAKNKVLARGFFKGPLEDFIEQYSSPPSMATGLYQIHSDEEGLSESFFYAEQGNTPQEAAFKLGLMKGFRRFRWTPYPYAFSRANQEAKDYERTSSLSDVSDYLYVFTPSEEEEEDETSMILKAYRGGNNPRLFFEGSLESFIDIFGKN